MHKRSMRQTSFKLPCNRLLKDMLGKYGAINGYIEMSCQQMNTFDSIAERYHHNFKNQLESMLSIREAIAHTGSTTVTYTDFIGHIDIVDDFINRLDRVLYTHCCIEAGSQYWPR